MSEREHWTDAQGATALGLFLSHGQDGSQATWDYLAAKLQAVRPGTTPVAVMAKLWRVATVYDGAAKRGRPYVPPPNRPDRTSKPWTDADTWVMKIALDLGGRDRDNPAGLSHVALVLARSVAQVRQAYHDQKNTRPDGATGFGLHTKAPE